MTSNLILKYLIIQKKKNFGPYRILDQKIKPRYDFCPNYNHSNRIRALLSTPLIMPHLLKHIPQSKLNTSLRNFPYIKLLNIILLTIKN